MEINQQSYLLVTDEQQNPVVMEGTVLLCNRRNNEIISVPISNDLLKEFELQSEILGEIVPNKEPNSVNSVEQHCSKKNTDNNMKVWSSENTILLINIVKEMYEQFNLTLKKRVWERVATKLSEAIGQKISAFQCETKWKTLKRTYKTIILFNKTSGQKKRYWEFYDLMNDILFDKPEVNPVATCSSLTGLEIRGNLETQKNKEGEENEIPSKSPDSSKFESSFSKKRKLKQSEADRRHLEKMSRLDRFNDIFEKMVEKLPSSNSN